MFQIAIAGELSQDTRLFDKLNEYLEQIRKYINPIESLNTIRFISSPVYASLEWFEWAAQSGCGITGYGSADEHVPIGVEFGRGV